jgi:septum formation protein
MQPLVLASASPRRAELLRNAGIEFIVAPAHIHEERRAGESPEDYVCRVARDKAALVAAQYPGQFVLGADTEVIVDGGVLGKPRDAADAARMLRLLSGRTHLVSTGLALLGPEADESAIETTAVTMSELTEEEIRVYVAGGEPMDKAGAYAIQGIASRWVSRLDGCYFNVVGLPVPRVYRMLRAHELVSGNAKAVRR